MPQLKKSNEATTQYQHATTLLAHFLLIPILLPTEESCASALTFNQHNSHFQYTSTSASSGSIKNIGVTQYLNQYWKSWMEQAGKLNTRSSMVAALALYTFRIPCPGEHHPRPIFPEHLFEYLVSLLNIKTQLYKNIGTGFGRLSESLPARIQ